MANYFSLQAQNVFKNDGSFLEVYKRFQQQQQQALQQSNSEVQVPSSNTADPKSTTIKTTLPIIGKRKNKILKTGVVKKVKRDKKKSSKSIDPWSLYLEEVKRYQETVGEQDNKTRSLVK